MNQFDWTRMKAIQMDSKEISELAVFEMESAWDWTL